MAKDIKKFKLGNWFDKSYYFFGDYLSNKYNGRVLKLPINANLSCPNRDGTINNSGCIFCSEDGSASPTTLNSENIIKQMSFARNNFKRSDIFTKYIAYFQAYTNTHAPIDILKNLYDTAIKDEDIIGLMIGTRPDSINRDTLDLISTYKKNNFELWLEIGLQTIHDSSLKFLNRGHNYKSSKKSIIDASEKGIKVCAHIILGIPGETWEMMMQTADELSSLPINGVKFHHLHVIDNTPLHSLYDKNEFNLLSMKEYVSILCDFIERLRADIIIHRLLGDRNEKSLIAPMWGMHKGTVLRAIDEEFKKRGTYQSLLSKYNF